MRNTVQVTITLFVLTLLACQDSSESSIKFRIDYKNVGKQIPMEVALRWRSNSVSIQNARVNDRFYVSKSSLENLMAPSQTLTGVAFHYGIDELGLLHIVVIPVDENLKLWHPETTRIIDTNSDQEVSLDDAMIWTQNFKAENPDKIWFHFIGVNTLNEILSVAELQVLDIEPVINDEGLPQLLLFVWNNEAGGRIQFDGIVFDKTFPCPPCEIL